MHHTQRTPADDAEQRSQRKATQTRDAWRRRGGARAIAQPEKEETNTVRSDTSSRNTSGESGAGVFACR